MEFIVNKDLLVNVKQKYFSNQDEDAIEPFHLDGFPGEEERGIELLIRLRTGDDGSESIKCYTVKLPPQLQL